MDLQKPKRICSCGDPNCPGGENPLFGSDPSKGNDVSSYNDYMRKMAILIEAQSRGSSGPFRPNRLDSLREPVAQFILSTEHSVDWSDVIGNEPAKQALMEAIEAPVTHAQLYKHYGMKPPKGVLLYGPPGCGKTMFAKAAAAAMARLYGKASEIIAVAGPALQSSYVAKTEETIRAIFAYAREYRRVNGHPLIVFIDECETILPDRTGRDGYVQSWQKSQVAQFLSELDGMEENGAFVILASNRPEAIDEALLRDGRCDRKIKIERPNQLAVESILSAQLRLMPLADDFDSILMAGVESLYNPHYVLQEAHILVGGLGPDGPKLLDDIAKNFNLEHIISGALVAGLATRAKAKAFRRDQAAGTVSGITVADMLAAVNEVYEENKGLEHSFAINEWRDSLNLEALAESYKNKGLRQ